MPLRIVLAKVRHDGHVRGVKVAGRARRDAGCEVVHDHLGLLAETRVAEIIPPGMPPRNVVAFPDQRFAVGVS